MKARTKSGDEVDITISFPNLNQVAIVAHQGTEMLAFELISDVEASYRFMNKLPPFFDESDGLKQMERI